MVRRVVWGVVLALGAGGVAGCDRGFAGLTAKPGAPGEDATVADTRPTTSEYGEPLYKPAAVTPDKTPAGPTADPVIVPECHLVAFEKEDVPSQHDGVLADVKVHEGDVIKAGQLLALVDPRVAQNEFDVAEAKLATAEADALASDKTRDEAKVRWDRQLTLWKNRATSIEDRDAAKLTYERYVQEAISKKAGIKLAMAERDKARTQKDYCEIRSAIGGTVKTIYRKKGEAVKAAPTYEPVFLIEGTSRLRAEGLVEKQYVPRLRQNPESARVMVEAAGSDSPRRTLVGHLQEVTSVAVAADGKTIASASGDATVRLWDPASSAELRVLRHQGPVVSVTCSPPGSNTNLCVAGMADGRIWIWDLGSPSDKPTRQTAGGHRGAVSRLAFTPDGKHVASAGEDMEIYLWDAATGEQKYRFPAGHRAGVTSIQFTPRAQLVSAGRDNTLRLWDVGTRGAVLKGTMDRRTGDVTNLGASPDGGRVLYDQGKTLRVLSLPDGLTRGVLRSSSSAANFTTFALFSPDARLILTAGASEGRLQLWQAPSETARGSELRQLVAADRSPATCAAFAPDGSFIVTGTRDRQVLVWGVPSRQELDRQMTAKLTLVEPSVEAEGRKVRVWAEVDNSDGRLMAGDTATLVIYPQEK